MTSASRHFADFIRMSAARPRILSASVTLAGLCLVATPAAAQVVAVTNGGLNTNGQNTTCVDVDGSVYVVNGEDCNPGGITGADPDKFHYLSGLRFGPAGSSSFLNADGSASFGGVVEFTGGALFNSGAQFNGQVNFTGYTVVNQLNATTIVNSGALSTNSINTASFNATGNGRFGGSLTSGSFSTGSAQITQLRVAESAVFNTSVTINGKLSLAANTTVDAGGNRIQNVGAPIAGTDAANKDYVDSAVAGVQGSVAAISSQVADHETRITAVETRNVQQDNRLTAVEATNVVQDGRLTSVENTNVTQDRRLTSIENVNVGQDSRMTAIEAVNTLQSNQISTLQDQVGGLQTAVTGLRRNIKEANGGIAAAVALGGTMVVPDSALSVSFNLATYRGEQGFSGSLVGRLAPKVYVNAGFGASTVRGSTAGRVGISFGL